MKSLHAAAVIAALMLVPLLNCQASAEEYVSPYAAWSNGPSTDPSYFPLGVWLQDPSTANQWKNAGINLFVGLWQGPTTSQLSTLQAADMQVIATKKFAGDYRSKHDARGRSPAGCGLDAGR